MKNPIDTPRGRQFDFVSYLAVRSAIISLGPEAIYLHYTYLSDPPSSDVDADPLSNPWVRRLQNHIKLAHHEPRTMGPKSFAHASDILRLELLRDTGGIYLDMDSFALRPFDQLLQSPYSRGRDVVLGHEGGNRWGLCNAVMVARPNSTFVERWLSTYYGTEATIKEESNTNTESTVLTLDNEWNYHSVTWPKEAQQKHPDEVCVLPPDAFF
ncbi:hypothetical protein VTK73DRAFT_2938 [Phialemonium thermophilum]|uniref:Glycosyltransferase family 32 protein n=1 Tax=Phialemonium thermophilum TaxID=223376 RepID=A0ABR3X232_9PEZI